MGRLNQMLREMYNENLVPITYISEANSEVVNHNRRLCILILLSERSEKELFRNWMQESERKATESTRDVPKDAVGRR